MSPNPSGPPPLPDPAAQTFRIPARTWITWALIVGAIIALSILKNRMNSDVERLSQYRFETLVDQGMIAHAVIKYSNQGSLTKVVGTYYKMQGDEKTEISFEASVRLTYDLERKLLTLPQVEPGDASMVWFSILMSLLPFLIVGAVIWFFFIRRIKFASRKGSEDVDRYDKLLDKWEEQAKRMDGVLDRMERKE